MSGKVVLVERGGGATAVQIAETVQRHGAVALVLVNQRLGHWPWVPGATAQEMQSGQAAAIDIPVLTVNRCHPLPALLALAALRTAHRRAQIDIRITPWGMRCALESARSSRVWHPFPRPPPPFRSLI